MPKKLLATLAMLAAIGCRDTEPTDDAGDIARRYTCFDGDYIVTVDDDITTSATCSTVVNGKTEHGHVDIDTAIATDAKCEVAGTLYELFPPAASQSDNTKHDLIRLDDRCVVYDRNTNAE